MRQPELFDEPLRPPIEGQVLRICRWPEVFETPHSRKYKSLTWISCPVSFNSTGYQNLLDRFDPWEAAALYGAWLALCQLAAQSDLRGRLCGDKGEAFHTRRIARLTGMSVEIFEVLIPWCLSVAWLEWAMPSEMYPSEATPGETQATEHPDTCAADVPATLPTPEGLGVSIDEQKQVASVSLPQQGIAASSARTLPNLTQPNLTQTTPPPTNAGGGAEVCFVSWDEFAVELSRCGVTATAKTLRAAKQAGYTLTQCAAIVLEFRSRKRQPFDLYNRFQLPSSLPTSAGWPESQPAKTNSAPVEYTVAKPRQPPVADGRVDMAKQLADVIRKRNLQEASK